MHFCEHDLLDHRAVAIEELRLERHRRFVVEPEAISVAELVARLNEDHLRASAQSFRRLAALDAVVLFQLFAVARNGGEQRTVALFDPHLPSIGQIADDFVLVADELATAAVQRNQTFSHFAAIDAMNDPHRLGSLVAQMNEKPFVVARGERLGHTLEPLARFAVASLRRGAREQG